MSVTSKQLRDDRGFTLIELIVASGLIVLVLSVLGGIMISSMTTETSVRNVSTATSTGQLTTSSIELGIRNAATPITFSAPTTGDQMVKAPVIGSGASATYSCQGWYYSASRKTISYARSSTAITTASSWTVLTEGVTPLTAGAQVLTVSGSTVTFAFKVDAGKYPAVVFQSAVTSQSGVAAGSAGVPTC